MRNIMGPPVTGENFFGRDDERSHAKQLLRDGNHILLTAPRRVGKSSLMLNVCEDLRAEEWIVVSTDVQHVVDERGFLEEILKKSGEGNLKLPVTYSSLVQKVRDNSPIQEIEITGFKLKLGGASSYWDVYTRVLETAIVNASKEGKTVLIAIDELPIFLMRLAKDTNGLERVRTVLLWLRSIRNANQSQMIFCGSVGLDTFVERYGLAGTINDMVPQSLGNFSDAVAVNFLQKLSPFILSDAVSVAILVRLGWAIPYYLRLIVHGLNQLPDARRTSQDFPNLQDVNDAYTYLLQAQERNKFAHWDSRLEEQFDEVQNVERARRILAHLCKKNEETSFDTIVVLLLASEKQPDEELMRRHTHQILNLLVSDGYLQDTKDTYTFRSFLLRDYWKKYHA
jgi:uncharacterized protein